MRVARATNASRPVGKSRKPDRPSFASHCVSIQRSSRAKRRKVVSGQVVRQSAECTHGNIRARFAQPVGKLLRHRRVIGRWAHRVDVRGDHPRRRLERTTHAGNAQRIRNAERNPFWGLAPHRAVTNGHMSAGEGPADLPGDATAGNRHEGEAKMTLARRQLLKSLVAASLFPAIRLDRSSPPRSRPLLGLGGDPDWLAIRALFPLAPDWTHLSSFLFVSHPKPVADAIDHFRKKLDSDATWIEIAAFSDAERRPFHAVKRALADYIGGSPTEIALTSNTTTALAMVYQGLRIRQGKEVLTTEHDHYSHHESIRYAAARSGGGVRYIALFDTPAGARADKIGERIARAITPATRAVGVTWVQSSTGIKLPIAGIAEAVARANRGRTPADRCLLIVDGVHGFANQDVDIARLGADFFASGGHKWLFAPRGTGVLWGRSDAWPELRPTIPSFDPDTIDTTFGAWGARTELPPTQAAF